MYNEALEEVNNVKSEYESKLIIANDNLTVTMAENEVLKEKVDVLFKLGRSYLNREIEGKEKIKDKNDQKSDDDEDIQEVGAETEVTDEDLSAWTKNKLRGFKRTAPTASSQPKAPTPKRTEKKTPTASPPPLEQLMFHHHQLEQLLYTVISL